MQGTHRHRPDMFTLSGWLFADLLLGLAIMFLVSGANQEVNPLPTLTPTPVPTATRYPTYTPFPTFTSYPTPTSQPTATFYPTYTPLPTLVPTAYIGLEQTAIIVTVPPNGDIISIMSAELNKHPDRQAGFVITFGYDRNLQEGVNKAKAANLLIKQYFAPIFPTDMPTKNLAWYPDDSGAAGTIKFEIFFISEIK